MAAADPWFDAVADGVVVIEGGRVVRLNAAAAAMVGLDPARAIGAALIGALRDHRLEAAFHDGTPVEIVRRGRTVRVEPHPWGLVLRDVSEPRHAREEARELLVVLSHELRTPVTAIHATMEALAYPDLGPDDRARFLHRAEGEAARLVRLLNDLTVDVAPPRARSVPLHEAASRAIGVLTPTLAEHGVDVDVTGPELTAWADPDKLHQVLVNLLENAALHGPGGGPVTIDVTPVVARARVAVRDRGVPLPPDRFDALFEAHAGAHVGETLGTGLGLYVVRSIAERWGGRAWGAPWHEAGEGGNEFGVEVPTWAAPRT